MSQGFQPGCLPYTLNPKQRSGAQLGFRIWDLRDLGVGSGRRSRAQGLEVLMVLRMLLGLGILEFKFRGLEFRVEGRGFRSLGFRANGLEQT